MVSKPNKEKSVKKQAGRPPHEVSEKIAGKLESLIMYGIPQEEIASHIGVSLNTLKKFYPEIFENAKECRHNAVKAALFHQAVKLNIPASTIFYLKTQCEEFQEKRDIEGVNGDSLLAAIAAQLKDMV